MVVFWLLGVFSLRRHVVQAKRIPPPSLVANKKRGDEICPMRRPDNKEVITNFRESFGRTGPCQLNWKWKRKCWWRRRWTSRVCYDGKDGGGMGFLMVASSRGDEIWENDFMAMIRFCCCSVICGCFGSHRVCQSTTIWK